MPNLRHRRRLIMRRRVATSSLDSDYLLWKAAVGSVGATQETATNALIVSLKAHSLWTVHDRIWLLAAENATQALTDIKSLSVATNSGSTFTASQGYAGNASSTFVDTGFAPSAGTNFTQNSASYSIYVRTSRATAANKSGMGAYDDLSSGNACRFFPHGTGSVIIASVNADGSFPQTASTNAQGFYTVSRTGSTTTNVYKNSSSSSIFTDATTSAARITTTFYVGAQHISSAGGNFFSDDQIAIVTFGAGLSGADAAQLQTDGNTYMAALGTNVY
jgi:hypothetical protein